MNQTDCRRRLFAFFPAFLFLLRAAVDLKVLAICGGSGECAWTISFSAHPQCDPLIPSSVTACTCTCPAMMSNSSILAQFARMYWASFRGTNKEATHRVSESTLLHRLPIILRFSAWSFLSFCCRQQQKHHTKSRAQHFAPETPPHWGSGVGPVGTAGDVDCPARPSSPQAREAERME